MQSSKSTVRSESPYPQNLKASSQAAQQLTVSQINSVAASTWLEVFRSSPFSALVTQ